MSHKNKKSRSKIEAPTPLDAPKTEAAAPAEKPKKTKTGKRK